MCEHEIMLRSASNVLDGAGASALLTMSGVGHQHHIPPPKRSHHWDDHLLKERIPSAQPKNSAKSEERIKVKGATEASSSPLVLNSVGTVYPATELLQGFTSIACDASGQYVAAYTGYLNQVFVSQDYGVTYTQTFSYLYSYEELGNVAIAANAPSYMAVTGYDGIYASTNTGSSFTLVPSTANIYNWAGVTLSSTGQYSYAICCGGESSTTGKIYLSSDYMSTYTVASTASTQGYLGLTASSNGQYVFPFTSNNVYASTDYGSTWSIVFTLNYLTAIGCSSTGQYVGITTENAAIYISSNYGKGWTKATLPALAWPYWSGIAFSSNGQKVIAVSNGGPVFTSTNYGSSFQMTNSPSQQYISTAISSDGQYMYAVSDYGYTYASTDSGQTWSPLYYNWYGTAMSQNGQTRYAVTFYDPPSVYMSSDSGMTWNSITSPYVISYPYWYSVTCNSDCQYVVITCDNNQLVISSNYGKSFKAITLGNPNNQPDDDYSAGFFVVIDIAISSTGQYMTVVPNSGPIYISSNYGSSFSEVTSSTIGAYWCVAMSSSGQYQLAGMIEYSYYSTARTSK